MRKENKFGVSYVLTVNDLGQKIYCMCCACMSVYSEFLSWANANPTRMTLNPHEADDIIILSCQVTDLAILNDLKYIETFKDQFPTKRILVGGCLAQRFDIDLPANVERLDRVCQDYRPIKDTTLIDYAPPFWVKNFQNDDGAYTDGHLFRNMYPLRIGVGCNGKCTYCTITQTRGSAYILDPLYLIEEFNANSNIVLIADSPTAQQIEEWVLIALSTKKPISIRNLEPRVAIQAIDSLRILAKAGLLKILHIPIQSVNPKILKAMDRSLDTVFTLLTAHIPFFRKYKVFCATNVIIDYFNRGENNNFEYLHDTFDYVSWNPLWNGRWDVVQANERFDYYIKKGNI